jgi:hypothetical protein
LSAFEAESAKRNNSNSCEQQQQQQQQQDKTFLIRCLKWHHEVDGIGHDCACGHGATGVPPPFKRVSRASAFVRLSFLLLWQRTFDCFESNRSSRLNQNHHSSISHQTPQQLDSLLSLFHILQLAQRIRSSNNIALLLNLKNRKF